MGNNKNEHEEGGEKTTTEDPIEVSLYFAFQSIYCKKSIVLALTSSHSSSSTGIESNQTNVTRFDLVRSHQTQLLVSRKEVRENSLI